MIETVRGGGIRQPAIAQAASKLDGGKWVHLFPEGKILCEHDHDLHKFKWGVGQILLEAREVPYVVPMHISGQSCRFVFRSHRDGWRRIRHAFASVAHSGVSPAVAHLHQVWRADQRARRSFARHDEECKESGCGAVRDYGSAAAECARVGAAAVGKEI